MATKKALPVAMGIASFALVLGVSGCGESEPSGGTESEEASATPETFAADITLTSATPVTLGYSAGDECGGMGNDAMKEGKPYKIAAKGETVAMGELPAGVAVENLGSIECHFEFSVELPSGLDFYTVDLGEFQGSIEFSEADLAAGVQADRIDFEGRN